MYIKLKKEDSAALAVRMAKNAEENAKNKISRLNEKMILVSDGFVYKNIK